MLQVSDPKQFYAKNHSELIGIFKSLGIVDEDLKDLSQQFYITLPEMLPMFDPNRGKFSTFIYECVKNQIYHFRVNKHTIRDFVEYNDSLDCEDEDVMQEISVRVEDFKRFCRFTRSTSTEKIIDEINSCLLVDTRGWTGVSYQCYIQHRDRFLESEKL